MVPVRTLFMLLFIMLAVSCGSDAEMDSNLPEPPPPPGQNPPTAQDADNDGIADADDQCPETPAGENADENGCSVSQKDSDGDGVNDDADQCPGTPSATEVDESGCSDSQNTADTDGDAIPDSDDDCPDTPEGEEVDENGCSSSQRDSDGDGVKDDVDQCPDTPEGENVDDEGCSDSQKDDDEDGVSNAEDQCPHTQAGVSVNEEGCSDAQSDTSPPVVTNIVVDQITPTSFRVEWNLHEGSKGYIRFGTSSENYQDSTALEERFLDRHRQTVGGENPEPLTQNTTYYWQIYTEDKAGNTGYWEEQSTTTAKEEARRTYVPDDRFEQQLIDKGLDDVLDDYVLTANIENITSISIMNEDDDVLYAQDWIKDLTGLQDFVSLEELYLRGCVGGGFYISQLPNLRSFSANFAYGVIKGDVLTNMPNLEKYSYYGPIHVTQIVNNPKLKEVSLSYEWPKDGGTIELIENNPQLETFEGVFFQGWGERNAGEELVTPKFNNNPGLKNLILENYNTSELLIVNSPMLENLYFGNDYNDEGDDPDDIFIGLTKLDLTPFTALKYCKLVGNALPDLDVSNCKQLETLIIEVELLLSCIKVNQNQLDNTPPSWNIGNLKLSLDCN